MQEKLEILAQILEEKKAEDIQIIDMTGSDYMANYVLIASVLHSRHGISLKEELTKKLKAMGEKILGSEDSDEWIVIDLGDALIHLMSPNYRAKYNIEEFLADVDNKKNEI